MSVCDDPPNVDATSQRTLRRSLRIARAASDEVVTLADDVALLVEWLGHDILTVAGPCYADRCQLYDFVVAELKVRAFRCLHRLEPICRAPQNQRDDLLAFAPA